MNRHLVQLQPRTIWAFLLSETSTGEVTVSGDEPPPCRLRRRPRKAESATFKRASLSDREDYTHSSAMGISEKLKLDAT